MSKIKKRVFKLIWAWEEEKEERWLREMANKGWLLQSYFIGFYTFVKSEPGDYIYKLDYRVDIDEKEYLNIFEDAGWTHVAQFLGWHYFRVKADQCDYPEIYSDNVSKIHKYKSLLKLLVIVTLTNLFNVINIVFINRSGPFFENGFVTGFQIVMLSVLVFLLYGIFKITNVLKDLKDEL